jgi:hypothetical protein
MAEIEAKERHPAPSDLFPDATELPEFLTEEIAGVG